MDRAARGQDSVDPRASLRRLYFDTVLNSASALGYLIDEVGVEHLMLGSDDPYEGGDPTPVESIGRIPGLSERERALIAGGNVARVLTGLADLGGATAHARP